MHSVHSVRVVLRTGDLVALAGLGRFASALLAILLRASCRGSTTGATSRELRLVFANAILVNVASLVLHVHLRLRCWFGWMCRHAWL